VPATSPVPVTSKDTPWWADSLVEQRDLSYSGPQLGEFYLKNMA